MNASMQVLKYQMLIQWSDEDIPDFPGSKWLTHGNTYQKAVENGVEFNDRYRQASTYFAFGSLAKAEGNSLETRANFQQALERYIEFRDDYWAEITKQRIEGLE